MRSRSEQIEVILREGTWPWARAQLRPGEAIDDRQYGDFIQVTPEEVFEHVMVHGFDLATVWTPKDPPEKKDDRLVVEAHPEGWCCYYAERGTRRDERVFAEPTDAVRDAVMRLMKRAWVTLNHRYWHRHHPTLEALPAFGEPWPG